MPAGQNELLPTSRFVLQYVSYLVDLHPVCLVHHIGFVVEQVSQAILMYKFNVIRSKVKVHVFCFMSKSKRA